MAVIVIVRGNGGELREDIEAGQHRLVADEPLEAGGKEPERVGQLLDAGSRANRAAIQAT